MAFRLRIDEPITKGFRRIGVEQIERARRQLAANADPATEIHEARKGLKRVRALLRLGREGLGDAVFRSQNAAFRSAAALLAPARDDHVLLETVAKLAAADANDAGPALARLKAAILATRTPASAGDVASRRAEAEAAIAEAQRRFRRLALAPDSFATLERGFVRNYRKGLAARDIAYADGSDEAFHEWRKCVQTLWRHLALLSRAWPALFEAHIEAARELSQILGDDHDLALLRQKLAVLGADGLPAADVEELETLIRSRQQALRRAAEPRGARIFAERPKAIGRRITAVWESAARQRREEARDEKQAPEGRGHPRQPAQERS